MSDRFIHIGQYVPPISRTPIDPVPISSSSSKPSDLSFQNVLTRQSTASAQLRSIPQSSVPRQPYTNRVGIAKNLPTTSTPPVQEGEIVLTPQPGSPVAMDSEWLKKSSELIHSLPQNLPQGKEFEAQVLQNFHDYQAMKTSGVFPDSQNSQLTATSPPPILDAMEAYSRNNTPIQTEPSESTEAVTTGAFNSILSKNLDENSTANSISKSSSHVPSNRFKQNRRQVDSADSSSPISETSKKSGLTKSVGNPSETSPTKAAVSSTNNEKPQTKGFFETLGSFFSNLASGLTLGIYRPKGEPEPTGINRVVYPLKKLIFDAPIQDLAVGIPVGMVQTVSSPFRKTNSSTSTPIESTSSKAETIKTRHSHSRLIIDGNRPVTVSRITRPV